MKSDFWPAEILEANYEAIRLATATGIVVVEAAGNGGYDLDTYRTRQVENIFDRRSRRFSCDSGAHYGLAPGAQNDPHTGSLSRIMEIVLTAMRGERTSIRQPLTTRVGAIRSIRRISTVRQARRRLSLELH